MLVSAMMIREWHYLSAQLVQVLLVAKAHLQAAAVPAHAANLAMFMPICRQVWTFHLACCRGISLIVLYEAYHSSGDIAL